MVYTDVKAARAAVDAGQVVEYGGRTAATPDELDFIVAALDNEQANAEARANNVVNTETLATAVVNAVNTANSKGAKGKADPAPIVDLKDRNQAAADAQANAPVNQAAAVARTRQSIPGAVGDVDPLDPDAKGVNVPAPMVGETPHTESLGVDPNAPVVLDDAPKSK